MGKFSNKSKAGPSKRRSLKDKYKIQRKVRAHKKKTRKQARKLQILGKKRRNPKQQPLPNLYPFKAEIIQAAKKQKQLQKKMIQHKKIQEEIIVETQPSIQQYIDSQTFIKQNDVFIIILDARNPNICREQIFQQNIQKSGKKIVFILNKIDLIPFQIAQKWQLYLNKSHPTILFRATSAHKNIENQANTSKRAIGVNSLLHTIKRITNNQNVKLGISGCDKVGKKSLFQMIKNTNSKSTQEANYIKIDRQINLLKSFCRIESKDQSNIIFRNPYENVREFIENMLSLVNKDSLLTLYQIQDFSGSEQFLVKTSKSLRKLLKGGKPDIIKTQKQIIEDWRSGKILFYQPI